jgi:uncharacterized protein (TIGR02594 family)
MANVHKKRGNLYMTPIWLTKARAYIGTKEIPGPKNNPVIMGWAARLGGWVKSFYKNDEIPWCGLFMAAVMQEAGLPAPKGALSAAAWASWGVALPSPALGAALVFKRPGGGHVGLYVGEDATHYHVLGGNQGDAVSVVRISKDRCVAVRWPAGAPLPTEGRVMLTAVGAPVSTNEA